MKIRLLTTLALALVTGCQLPPSASPRLILATTTSTEDSGLLDYLLPEFESTTGLDVQVVAVGSGQALALGRNGDVDVLLVHAPQQEEQFMAEGHGMGRRAVMVNDFVIVGPPGDPAGIRGLSDAAAALACIAQAQATFVSRGDDSGTHMKERAVWEAAGITPQGAWYIAAGQGMGEVLTMAEQLGAYTLSDRGTYLSRLAQGYGLAILLEDDPFLLNPYHVIAVNPARHPGVNYRAAQAFITWLTSLPTQERIAAFVQPDSGQPLFYPDSPQWHAAHP